MCRPVWIRIMMCMDALLGQPIIMTDDKDEFLQTGESKRDVYVRAPRKSKDHRHDWPLLAAAYGLVNSRSNFRS